MMMEHVGRNMDRLATISDPEEENSIFLPLEKVYFSLVIIKHGVLPDENSW
jgi:hypothetical protein